MYYQILIETIEKIGKTQKNRTIASMDISDKNEIIDDVLIPYLEDKEFTVNGYILSRVSISRLKVMTTERSVYELSEYKNNTMPSGVIMYISPQDILGYHEYTVEVTKQLLKEARGILENNKVSEKKDKGIKIDARDVFIVHGHDDLAVEQTENFVKSIGLNPIVLHKQANLGKTIIEKIEEYSNVGFAIVLYTPCDVGASKEDVGASKEKVDKLQYRARQNVVFEHGYLIGKLGRERVVALVKGNIEKPNDISGIVYVNMDANKAWRFDIVRDMKKLGYEIDANNLL